MMEPARWAGMTMGCNCTAASADRGFSRYYEGSCTYFLTLQGCSQLLPQAAIQIYSVLGQHFCLKRYEVSYFEIERPSVIREGGLSLGEHRCKEGYRVCGGNFVQN